MLVDEVKINLEAGRGGDGAVSFRHEKYIDKGGPDGGDGGDGGNIIIECRGNVDSLNTYKHQKDYSAENGSAGSRNRRHGKNGADLLLFVPPGTVIENLETRETLCDLKKPGDSFLAAKGGKGGLGNVHFATPTHRVPREFKPGEPGDKVDIKLEMKMIADVGLIGLPNAGKSTLISAISNARPKIAGYPFTTIEPVLGMVAYDDKSFVVCDVPGLIEGAAHGRGLGDKFLKHIERTKLLVHLIDPTAGNVAESYKAIRKELELYSKELTRKEEIIVLTKSDLNIEVPSDFKYDLFISAATGSNINELIKLIITKLK